MWVQMLFDGISVFYAIQTEGLHDISTAVGEDVKCFIRFFERVN